MKKRKLSNTHKPFDRKTKSHYYVRTYLAGIITVIGTLNRGPQVGAAVSYPHTYKKNPKQNNIQE